VSTQAPAQSSLSFAQLSEQAPFEQTLPTAQTWSQPPQCLGSLLWSTQAAPHAVNGARQESAQAPALHWASPATVDAHACPQPPQFRGSAARSTQVVPHGENGLLQAKLQAPCKQMPLPFGGELQVAPQPPQLFASRLGLVQTPLQRTSSARQVAASSPDSAGPLLTSPALPGRTHSLRALSQT